MAGAWCMMRLNRPAEAVTRFRAVLSNGSAKDRQDAAYGLSLAYLRLGLTSEAAAASSQAPQPGGRVKELSTAILTQRIVADYQAGRYADALIGLDSRAHLVPEQTDLLILRGWCYFHLNRYDESKQVFTAAAATGRADAASALVAVQQATKGH
jgi:tetratricopeptide (TPR) repeat protein